MKSRSLSSHVVREEPTLFRRNASEAETTAPSSIGCDPRWPADSRRLLNVPVITIITASTGVTTVYDEEVCRSSTFLVALERFLEDVQDFR